MAERAGPKIADCSPYLTLENLDPKWLEVCGGDTELLKEQREKEREKERDVGRGAWIERKL